MIREAHHGGLHEEFKLRIKTQTVLPSVETAAIWFWALMPSGQIAMRKGDGWRTPAERPSETMDLAASSSNLVPMEIAPKTISNHSRDCICRRKSLTSKARSRPCPASIGKIAADDPAIMLAEDLPVAAVLGNVTVCVQVTRHGRPRA